MSQTTARPTSDGYLVGEAVTDKIGLYGVTPVAQRASALQAAVTDGTTDGTAGAAADLAALKAEAELIGDTLRATVILVNRLRLDLIALGAIKGAA